MSQDLEKILRDDLQRAGQARKILYLEGTSDPEYLFALLGMSRPKDDIHQGILVRGLSGNEASGAAAVQGLLQKAAAHPQLSTNIFGINDGDGEAVNPDRSAFVATGQLLVWPCYCIENLFYGTGWPTSFGPPPNWFQDLEPYAPYVAVNQLQREAQETLKKLGIDHFINPSAKRPLKTVDAIRQEMRQHEHLLVDLQQVPQRFECYTRNFLTTLGRSVDDAHVLFNGKWLFTDFVPRRTGLEQKKSESAWLAHARATGGHPQVRDLWRRIAGRLPS